MPYVDFNGYHFINLQGCEGKEPGLAAVVTLASSLDYTTSKSTLKLLLPLVSRLGSTFYLKLAPEILANYSKFCLFCSVTCWEYS